MPVWSWERYTTVENSVMKIRKTFLPRFKNSYPWIPIGFCCLGILLFVQLQPPFLRPAKLFCSSCTIRVQAEDKEESSSTTLLNSTQKVSSAHVNWQNKTLLTVSPAVVHSRGSRNRARRLLPPIWAVPCMLSELWVLSTGFYWGLTWAVSSELACWSGQGLAMQRQELQAGPALSAHVQHSQMVVQQCHCNSSGSIPRCSK